jgi:putative ATPase
LLSEYDKTGEVVITDEQISQITNKMGMHYDKDGDMHYDILSAFHKSLRGSDVNASVHYLARLIEAGDLISICRRLLAAASEDVGLAYPMLPVMVKSLVDSAIQLGFPEARLPLSNAAILIATAPKSNSVYVAIDSALYDIKQGKSGQIPSYLKDSHYGGAKDLGLCIGYKYPQGYENNYIDQQYLPDELKDTNYYVPGKNKNEQALKEYWKKVKGK